MKNIVIIVSFLFLLISCQKEKEVIHEEIEIVDATDYELFGDEFKPQDALTTNEMLKKYNEMEVGDSVEVAFNSKVNSVCQAKGCWMKLDLGEPEKESFVRFKDYGFFVPMDSEGSDVIIKGKAYKKEISVEELKHYAHDAKKTEEEIANITEPKIEYTFIADGVLLKKKEI